MNFSSLNRPFSSYVTAAATLVALPLMHLADRWSVGRTTRFTGRVARLEIPVLRQRIDQDDALVVAATMNGVARRLGLGETSCLARSQLLYLVLSWMGHAPVIRMGVDPSVGTGGGAHAWVEINGQPIGDSADVHVRYAAFDETLLP